MNNKLHFVGLLG